MANKNLFKSLAGRLLPAADSVNEAGGIAYSFGPKHALAQYAATGCLNSTFYAGAEEQLENVLKLALAVEPEFVAKVAVYARERGHMKDVPALLCAVLSLRAPALLAAVFPRVIDNAKMLRSFVQIMRSGAVGRKSLGTAPKRLVKNWLAARHEAVLFRASVGQDPSLADVIKMVHPKPANPARDAFYAYMIGRPHQADQLPEVVQQFESYKLEKSGAPPDVPFQMLTALDLGNAEWTEIAKRAGWQMTRMNLNTFARHGVFDVAGMAQLVAEKLRDEAAIRRSRVYPYQLLMAYKAADDRVPAVVRDALHDAMEVATENVPVIDGDVVVMPDVSGSMNSSISGYRKGSTSRVRCVDVAALFAASLLRKNPGARIIPFESDVVCLRLEPRDTVMSNAAKLAAVGGGGTNASAPLKLLNQEGAKAKLVVYVSDNESWIDSRKHGSTATLQQWEIFKQKNPDAGLVCIDLQPYGSSQAPDRDDILNVGGFSDQVFEVVAEFARSGSNAAHWVERIESIDLPRA